METVTQLAIETKIQNFEKKTNLHELMVLTSFSFGAAVNVSNNSLYKIEKNLSTCTNKSTNFSANLINSSNYFK
jgi:hypothetical protein